VFGPVARWDWLSVRPLAADRIRTSSPRWCGRGRVHAVDPGRGSLEARFLELLADDPGAPT
jgi:hypothetical protein